MTPQEHASYWTAQGAARERRRIREAQRAALDQLMRLRNGFTANAAGVTLALELDSIVDDVQAATRAPKARRK